MPVYPRLDIIDAEANVLWSFNDRRGEVNPEGVRAYIGTIDVGEETELETFGGQAPGGRVVHRRPDLTPMTMHVGAQPANGSYDELARGLNYLNRLLASGGRMLWQPRSTSPEKFIEYEPSRTSPHLRGEHQDDLGGRWWFDIEVLRQPLVLLPGQAFGPTDLSADPSGLALQTVINGEAPAPIELILSPRNSAARVQEYLVAAHTGPDVSGWVTETKHAPCQAAGSGWTLNTHPPNPALLSRQVRVTRTTHLDSLRGDVGVWVHVKATGAGDHRLQLRSAPSLADPTTEIKQEIIHDTSDVTSFDWVYKYLGSFRLPQETPQGMLEGLALEVWTDRASGSGALEIGHLVLLPLEHLASLVVPGAGRDVHRGAELASPPRKLSTDPTWVSGTRLESAYKLAALNQAAGTRPNAGAVWSLARHRITFDLSSGEQFVGTVSLRVVNVTDGVVVRSFNVTNGGGRWRIRKGTRRQFSFEFDSTAEKAYQLQANMVSYTSGAIHVLRIIRQQIPYLSLGQEAHTDPETHHAMRHTDGGAVLGPLGVSGSTPFRLTPGDVGIAVIPLDIRSQGYDEPRAVLARTTRVRGAYSPRDYL